MAEKKKLDAQTLVVAGILAWVIPGAGHWIGGRKRQAIVIFSAIVGAFFLGILLGGIEVIDPKYHNMWFIAQILNGLPAIIVAILQDVATPMQSGPKGAELGQVYTSIAGLLNLFCVIDAIAPDIKTEDKGLI